MPRTNSKGTAKRPAPNNFLEALRELGQDVASETKIQVSRAVTQDIPQSFGLSASGTLNPNESFRMPSPDSEAAARNDMERAFNSRLSQMREEERATLTRREATIKDQIKSIQEELRQFARSTGELSAEIQTATFQAAVNPGIYHKNFFAHLKSLLATLRKQVTQSKNWLAEFNGRSQKQGHYWGQVSKSGSKYMLSSERYMVTSTG